MKNIKSTAIIITTAVLLVACGGGGGGSSTPSPLTPDSTAIATSPIATVTANTVANYTNGITITTTVTDNNPSNGTRPTLGYATSPAGSCTISDATLSVYDGGTATATAKVNLLSAGTTCVVTATPNEAVAGTSANFTIAQEHIAPLLAVPATATGAAGFPVEFTVTATKQDPAFTTDIEFATDITASADCTVTAGAVTLGSPINIGDTYTRVYSVARATAGDCSIAKSMFIVREDMPMPHLSAPTANGGDGNIVISFIPDFDRDGVMDAMDVDEDGDGLIEIHTADELNQTRNDLAGSSFSGNSSGCGGSREGNALECNGYELMADIDLAAAGYNNWDPIGREDSAFSAIFEGNDYKVNNLKIQIDVVRNGWGFFSSITDATIRNLHLRDVNITLGIDNTLVGNINPTNYPTLIGNTDRVGGLVGSMANSLIVNSSAAGPLVAGATFVGGLVGRGDGGSQIVSSYAEFGEVNATYTGIGGLIGSGENIDIKLSYAVAGNIVGQSALNFKFGTGGLIGSSLGGAAISSSMALVANITNINRGRVGGLVGESTLPNYAFLAAIVNNISADVDAGGFVGFERGDVDGNGRITSSYVLNNHVYGKRAPTRGGFLGDLGTSVTVISSYWDNTLLTPPDTRTLVVNAVGKPTTDLQGPTDFTGIYETWGNGWCDASTNEFTTDASHPLAIDANRFWDLGTATEYPAMNCLPNFTPAEQRAAMAKALNGESPIRNLN